MSYSPARETRSILDRAFAHVQSVPYRVTARWVFYRLLQDGTLGAKADYKRLLGYLSSARKEFYNQWTPSSLTDESRAALIRGTGFKDGAAWVSAVRNQVSCNLDRWASQEGYVEMWFEAAAMSAQFDHYADKNVTLLAFHGDISIPEKWQCAVRLVDRWMRHSTPVTVLYYGDYDDKGLMIPETAERDIRRMAGQYIDGNLAEDFNNQFTFRRVGINDSHITQYDITENPERPGTYQWEGLEDSAAEELIGEGNDLLDQVAFAEVTDREQGYTGRFREHLADLDLTN